MSVSYLGVRVTARLRSGALAALVALVAATFVLLPASTARADAVGSDVGPFTDLWAIAVSPDGTLLYGTDENEEALQVIDIAAGTIVDTIPLGTGPQHLVISADGTRVYVSDIDGDTISVIDTTTNSVIETISVGQYPESIALTPAGDFLWVSNYDDDTVSVIDTSTNAVVDTVAVDGGPEGIAFAGGKAYISLWDTGQVAIVDVATRTVTGHITVGSNPYYAVASPWGDRVYVLNNSSDSVSVIDPATNAVIATIAVSDYPVYPVVTPDGSRLYVQGWNSIDVTVIDTATNTVIETLPMEANPWAIAVSPTLPEVYVSLYNAKVVRIDVDVPLDITSTVLANGAVGSGYSQRVVYTGWPKPTLSITGGSLPPGLSFDPATGIVSGTPTAVGTFAFTVLAENEVDGDPFSDEQEITITIVLADTGVEPTPYIAGAVLLAGLGAMLLAARRRHLA